MIRVIDNFLSEDYLYLIKHKTPELNWEIHSTQGDFANFFSSEGACDNKWPKTQIYWGLGEKIAGLTFITVSDIIRCYVNCYPIGENHCGNWHKDDGDITALYMPYVWDDAWGGGTAFREGDNSEIIPYKENRLVLFDSQIEHRARPHYSDYNFRYTVAFKLKAQWNENSINN